MITNKAVEAVPLEDLLRLGDEGCPHVDHDDAEAPTIGQAEQRPPFDLKRTIAAQVKSIPELTYWGMTPQGYSIYRQENGVGGHRYWSDEIGGGVVVWDTSLADPATLRWCLDLEQLIECEAERDRLEKHGQRWRELNSMIFTLRYQLGFTS